MGRIHVHELERGTVYSRIHKTTACLRMSISQQYSSNVRTVQHIEYPRDVSYQSTVPGDYEIQGSELQLPRLGFFLSPISHHSLRCPQLRVVRQ